MPELQPEITAGTPRNVPETPQSTSTLENASSRVSQTAQLASHSWENRMQLINPAPKRGRPIRKNLPLTIPTIRSAPSNTSGYVPSTPESAPSTLLPSFLLPSPITPTTHIIDTAAAGNFTPFVPTTTISIPGSAPHAVVSRTGPSESDVPLSSMWAFESSPSAGPNKRWMEHSDPSFSHSQPPARVQKSADMEAQRLEKAMCCLLDELDYPSVPDFFSAYLHQVPRGSAHSLTPRHRQSLQKFLQGRTKVTPVEIIERMYTHRYSYPSHKSGNIDERKQAFASDADPTIIPYARCSISSWATQLVGAQARRDIKALTRDAQSPDPDTVHVSARLVASANERTRAKGVKTVTKEDLMSFRFVDRARLFKMRAPLVWYLTECMAAPKKNGVLVARTAKMRQSY